VARDGIEPPTPAFSGPRSTTELSGLSANFGCISTRGIRAMPEKAGTSTYSALQQLVKYTNYHSSRQTRRAISPHAAIPALHWNAIMRRPIRIPVRLLACLILIASACSRSPAPLISESETRASRAFQSTEVQGALALHAFLAQFPKGADLHVHLSGAVYAETFIRDAAEDGLCVDPAALKFVAPPCKAKLVAANQLSGNMTSANQDLYDRLIDAFSLRSFVPTSAFSGHDQFFATFARFSGLNKQHVGEWVDEVASRSAAQNQQYLELMETPPFGHAATIAQQIGWKPDPSPADFGKLRQALLDHGLRDEVAADRADVSSAEAQRRQIEHCGTPQASPACQVEIRYIYQVLRAFPPEQVFAQTLLGFETIQATINAHEPGFVGINFVQPEDGFISMRDYTLQMKMLDYLHSVYPKVHISLHAGELAPGLVPPEGLRFHIRQAVELGHAERIGHGVDLMYEDDTPGLLKELAQKHVMIEINLSSNEGILGIKGDEHPFPLYRAAHVPVVLSTDDEGVSRIDITHEYVRAALDYHLTYHDLKQLARTGMEHSFLSGDSLWAAPDVFTDPATPCKGDALGQENPTSACEAFLESSEKAAAQWELERRFRVFEGKF
jgi:adenosine deaminase